MIYTGINDDNLNFEVALEVLGQRRQPIMRMLQDEKAKAEPSAALIQYCEDRLTAITKLSIGLRPGDTFTVGLILTPGPKEFGF